MPFAEYIETRVGGWAVGLERHHALMASATPAFLTRADDARMPDMVDCGDWSIIEDQGNQGACQGHGLSTAVECSLVRNGGKLIQLSRAQAYYESQRIDGIRGDSGSTVEGGIKLATETGLCLESAWPYPSSYNPQRPSGYDQAEKFKIAGHVWIRDWDSAKRHIGLVGPMGIGIIWGDEIDRQVSNTGVIEDYRGSGGGGHYVDLLGYRDTHYDGTPLGETCLDLYNSWSKRWGFNGRCLVKRRAFDKMLAHRFNLMVGIIGLPQTVRPDY